MSERPHFSPDDRLFVNTLRGKTFFDFHSTDIVSYATTYQVAGNTLLDRATSGFFEIFPALYCYRHAVEIALKDLIYVWDRMQTGKWRVSPTHKLTLLWPLARPALAEIWPDSDPDELEVVGRLIGELDALDPDGYQLRYAIDRSGRSRPLPPELEGVDLDNLREKTKRLADFLIAAGVALEEYAGHLADQQVRQPGHEARRRK